MDSFLVFTMKLPERKLGAIIVHLRRLINKPQHKWYTYFTWFVYNFDSISQLRNDVLIQNDNLCLHYIARAREREREKKDIEMLNLTFMSMFGIRFPLIMIKTKLASFSLDMLHVVFFFWIQYGTSANIFTMNTRTHKQTHAHAVSWIWATNYINHVLKFSSADYNR